MTKEKNEKIEKKMKAKKAVKILASLAQETRLAIFRLLIQESKDGLSAGQISEILGVPAATLSFHLSQLANAGLVRSRKDGRVVYYATKNKTIKQLMMYLTWNSYKKRMRQVDKAAKQGESGEEVPPVVGEERGLSGL